MTASTGTPPYRSRSSHWRAGYSETGPSGSEGGRAEKDQPRLAPRRTADPTRHLIGDRLDISGARWGLQGAEAVLKLRALKTNGDFDRYWHFHLACENQRVHSPHDQDTYDLAA
jgi:hypothetical protein